MIDLFRSLDGLEDSHLGSQLDQDPESRLWEMMVAHMLRTEGYDPQRPPGPAGPDFLVVARDVQRIFIEATCPGSGEVGRPDSVAPIEFGAAIATLLPVREIVLRLCGALREKAALGRVLPTGS